MIWSSESSTYSLNSTWWLLKAWTARFEWQQEDIDLFQSVDFNNPAPQMKRVLLNWSNDISSLVKELWWRSALSPQAYFDIVMHCANKAINDEWPTQDETKRKQQLLDVLDDNSAEENYTVEAHDTENRGAVVCVYKAACLYKLLDLHWIEIDQPNEKEPTGWSTEWHTNIIAFRPWSGRQEYDAGVITPLYNAA